MNILSITHCESFDYTLNATCRLHLQPKMNDLFFSWKWIWGIVGHSSKLIRGHCWDIEAQNSLKDRLWRMLVHGFGEDHWFGLVDRRYRGRLALMRWGDVSHILGRTSIGMWCVGSEGIWGGHVLSAWHNDSGWGTWCLHLESRKTSC